MNQGIALCLCGPSGVGKSTIIRGLQTAKPELFGFSVSHTTRKIRPGEKDGVHYFFVSEEEFEREAKQGAFLETAVFSKNRYGTSRRAVESVVARGRVCILDIDMQGILSMQAQGFGALYMLLCPPSMEELERRLRARGDTSEEQILSRLEIAKSELRYRDEPGMWDLVLVNEDMAECVQKILRVIEAKLNRNKS